MVKLYGSTYEDFNPKEAKRRAVFETLSTIALYLFGVVIISYGVFHVGRWYESNYQEEKVKNQYYTYFFTDPEVIDPFINGTKDLFITGGLEVGDCFTYKN